jgi:hypothetical protein
MNITDLCNMIPTEGKMAGVRKTQIQEVIRIVLKELASAEEKEVAKLLARYKG